MSGRSPLKFAARIGFSQVGTRYFRNPDIFSTDCVAKKISQESVVEF